MVEVLSNARNMLNLFAGSRCISVDGSCEIAGHSFLPFSIPYLAISSELDMVSLRNIILYCIVLIIKMVPIDKYVLCHPNSYCNHHGQISFSFNACIDSSNSHPRFAMPCIFAAYATSCYTSIVTRKF